MKTNKILIAILFAGSLFSISCSKKSATPEKHNADTSAIKKESAELVTLSRQAIKDIGLTTMNVVESDVVGEIIAPAKLVSNQDYEAYVGSMIAGRVGKVYVNLGSNVKKGEVLMLIEGLEIGAIKAQFLKTKANFEYAKSNYNRSKTLNEQNVGSQKQLLEAKAEYEKAMAEFYAEDKRIHSIGLTDADMDAKDDAEHKSAKLAVRAPVDGVIVERNVVIGQSVDNSTNAFKIVNTSSLFADAQIYESDLPRIVGKPSVKIKVEAYPNIDYSGKIIYVSDIVDKDKRTINIRAAISNANRQLKPEMFAEMRIPIGVSTRGIVVPSEAISRELKDSYVFVMINDTTFEKRDVKIGSVQGEKVEIKEGLKIGEKIVSKAAFMLKSEMKKSELGEGE